MIYIFWSWLVLHCWITLLLQNIYLVSLLWLLLYGILMSHIHDDPIMIQQLLLTSFFIDKIRNQTKQFNPFLVETAVCKSSSLLHYITIYVFASMTLPHFMYFIKCALDFCKVRSKLLGLTFKGKQNIFPCHQPLLSAAIALPHIYITKQLWCLLPLILNKYHWFAHWLSKDLWLLRNLSCHTCCPWWFMPWWVRSSECKQVMSCIHVGYSLISVHCYTTWCIQ